MQQYLDLLKTIQKKGTHKPGARKGLGGSTSLFGYQFRHDLSEGFPILTTKKIYWKAVVYELLWFLRGETNIKYLVDNGVNIWNEDAYNYYLKMMDQKSKESYRIPFDGFIELIRKGDLRWKRDMSNDSYKLGDCGFQYGKVWRKWQVDTVFKANTGDCRSTRGYIDQISKLISSLINTPESRRHLVTAIDPAHDQELALYWCHAMFQFNCRPLSLEQRRAYMNTNAEYTDGFGILSIPPRYYLDCQLYQRSADVVLGVPFNISSYALLTHIIAKICNMIPGEFIHTFGDVHIYDNHKEAVETQLARIPGKLPQLHMNSLSFEYLEAGEELDNFFLKLDHSDFLLSDYNPQPAIKAELSTGLR